MELGPASDGVRKNVLLVGMETGMFVLQAVVASFFLLLLFQARAPHTCLSSRYFVEHVEFCSAEAIMAGWLVVVLWVLVVWVAE